jgi:hypothetical protein
VPILERRIQGLAAEVGVARLFGRSLIADAVGATPPPEVLASVPVLYGASSHAATVRELEASPESAQQVQRATQSAPGVICRSSSFRLRMARRRIAAHHVDATCAGALLSTQAHSQPPGLAVVEDAPGHLVRGRSPLRQQFLPVRGLRTLASLTAARCVRLPRSPSAPLP